MSVKSKLSATLLTATFAVSLIAPLTANATIVRIETVLGDIDINLYDNATPATVTNFLDYVQNGAYSESIFHRSVPGFIVQGGGFQTDANADISPIPANPAVTNEPVNSNVRGTIAMAKTGGNANSATNQWFINLANNAANLDFQNSGFTAFGEVTGNGMDVVDAIAALPRFAFAAPLGDLPLRDFTTDDFNNQVTPDNSNLMIVTSITVIDTTVDSAGAAGLTPTPTTNTGTTTPPPTTGGGGGGGALMLLTLPLLAVCAMRRSRRRVLSR